MILRLVFINSSTEFVLPMNASSTTHPIIVAEALKKAHGNGLTFEFSEYVYRKQSVVDERYVFSVAASELDSSRIVEIVNALPEDRELAFHSRVSLNGQAFHIPMVDMHTAAKAQLQKLSAVVRKDIFETFYWFDSGRSFHGYGLRLLSNDEWVSFMGSLLLANLPGLTAIVDPRWVGHRLMAGYSALRWTKNTSQYLQLPKLVSSPEIY